VVRRSSGAIVRTSRHHIKTATKKEGPHLRPLFCIKQMCCCGAVATCRQACRRTASRGVQLKP